MYHHITFWTTSWPETQVFLWLYVLGFGTSGRLPPVAKLALGMEWYRYPQFHRWTICPHIWSIYSFWGEIWRFKLEKEWQWLVPWLISTSFRISNARQMKKSWNQQIMAFLSILMIHVCCFYIINAYILQHCNGQCLIQTWSTLI